MVYTSDLPDPRLCAALPPATRALVVDPEHYAVQWVINPHMAGAVGTVDTARARSQWEGVVAALVDAGLQVEVVPAVAGLCDLVFAANQSFPVRDGGRRVVLSKMTAAQRQPEVAAIASAWARLGFQAQPLGQRFEGGGDALWVPGRRLILCGWGFRTEALALEALAEAVDAPVVSLRLVDPRFYHLDTCLLPLDADCCVYVAEAFAPSDRARIHRLFPEAVAVPADRAARHFGCNGAVVNGRLILQQGATEVIEVARRRGLEVVEVPTDEFLKSGGSVTCLHLRF